MKFAEEKSIEVKEKIRQSKVAILPIGAVEAHGPHLPLATDNILAERLAALLAERTKGMLLPLLPYGQVWSLRDFPGSINVSNGSLIPFLVDIGTSLHHQGFRIFAIVNGHLGNQTALKEAARILYDQFPDLKVFYFFYPGMKEVVEEVRESKAVHASYFHACEIETSIMLYLAEEYVDMDRAISETPMIDEVADFTPTPWQRFTKTAVLGEARLATKEKGEKIVERALEKMIAMINKATANPPTGPRGQEP